MNQGSRQLIRSWSIAVLPVVALLASACGGNSSTPSQTASTTGGGATLQVTAQNFFFSPKALSAAPGSQVTLTFTNSGSVRHSFTAPDVSADTEAGPGETHTVTFTLPASGTVTFHCKFHPSLMTGTITAGGAPAQGGGSTTQTGSTTSGPGYGY